MKKIEIFGILLLIVVLVLTYLAHAASEPKSNSRKPTPQQQSPSNVPNPVHEALKGLKS